MEQQSAITVKPATAADETAGRRHYLWLAVIVLLGISLRFAWLEHPSLWGDECKSWWRTCGTFKEFLQNNQDDGFVPLHYEMYWLLRQICHLTPWMIRLVPAVAGSLMIPAMYFLSRQLLRPRASLLVALLTATSAFMLNYSRDGKMYMQAWFLITLHAGCFLWWIRKGGGLAWWSWVAAGSAAVGFHSITWMVIGMEVLIYLTWQRPRIAKTLFYLLGLAVIATGPAIFYTGYNQWTETSGGLTPGDAGQPGDLNWNKSGIAWIEIQTQGKTGMQLVRDSASAYLIGFSRAEEEPDRSGMIPLIPWVVNLAWGVMAGIVLVVALATVRWPVKASVESVRGDVAWWRPLLWLSCWLVLPTYAVFYCRTLHRPLSPLDWLEQTRLFFGWHSAWMAGGVVVLAAAAAARMWVRRALAGALLAMMATLVAISVWQGGATWYVTLMGWAGVSWITGLACVLGLALNIAGCGESWAERGRRMAVAGGIVLAVMLACYGAWRILEVKRLAAEAKGVYWHSIWMPRYLAIVWPAMVLALVVGIGRLPSRVLRWVVICLLVAANLAQYTARLVMEPEPQIERVIADWVRFENDAETRMYVRDHVTAGAPGGGSMLGAIGLYHYWVATGKQVRADMRIGETRAGIRMPLLPPSPSALREMLAKQPEVLRVVIWARMSLLGDGAKGYIDALAPSWDLKDRWEQETMRHWNWQKIDGLLRLEFVRKAQAATGPTSRPATGL